MATKDNKPRASEVFRNARLEDVIQNGRTTGGSNLTLSPCGARRRLSVPGTTQGTGISYIGVYPSVFQFDAIQLVYTNHDTTQTYDVDIAKAAPSPTFSNNGTGLTWTSVTFAGSASVTVAQATGSGADIIPGIAYSDVIPMQSVARSDGGSPFLLQTRCYSAGVQNPIVLAGTEFALINALNSGREQWASRSVSGDHVTSIDSQTPLATGNVMHPAAVIFYSYSTGYRNILWGGDSRVKGQGSTANNNGFLEQACVLAGSAVPRSIYNWGFNGQKHTASMTILRNILASFKPDIVGCQIHSVNDTTAAGMVKSVAETLSFLQYCKGLGVPVILETCAASNTVTAASTNPNRLAMNIQARQMCAAGLAKLLDTALLLDDPANSTQLNPLYDSGDNIHYNDAGYAVLASALQSYI